MISSDKVFPLRSKKDLKAFLKLPWKIHSENPNWVPPLLRDQKKLIDKKNNPFYQHSEAEFFIAWRNGEPVGRIGAIINRNHNLEHKDNVGFFGFFECINDQLVANLLFDTVADWLKSRGMDTMRGPANPSPNDEWGLLINGFDDPPVILMPYNPPYYINLIESAGLKKVKDMYAYQLRKEDVLTDRLVKTTELIRQREGLSFRQLNMKDFDNEIKRVRDLYNRAWQYNWGAVPMTTEEINALAKDLKPVVVPELVIFAEYKGEPIGFSLSLPDLNMALKYNKSGRLLTGLYCLYRYKKKIDRIRILVLGVIRERQKTGAAGVLFYETAMRAIKLGYQRGEAGWVLEDNVMMNRAAELLNATRYKTYRLFEKSLK